MLPDDETYPAPDDINIVLACSIFEFYNGSLKKLEYQRDVLLPDGKSMDKVDETITIEVKSGYGEKTVLTYPSRGNQNFTNA